MFDFRNGMLGVVIVALALGGAIFGAYFAGIESVEHEVVKYNELADVTGLFDTDKSPQYIDFDPSTNYVGYYSEESYSEEMGKYYFAEDQVGYIPNQKEDGTPIVNNYKIDLEPEIYDIRTVDIDDLRTAEDQPLPVTDRTYIVRYVATTVSDSTYWRGHATVLSDVISNMTYSEGTKQIRYTTRDVDWEGDYSQAGSGRMNLDTVLIIPQSWFRSYGSDPVYQVGIVNPAIDPSTISITGGANSPIQSMIVDIMQKKAEVYSDPDYQNIITTYELDKLFIFYGDDPYSQSHPRLNLGDFSFQEVASRTSYLNPNKGVYLKGGE